MVWRLAYSWHCSTPRQRIMSTASFHWQLDTVRPPRCGVGQHAALRCPHTLSQLRLFLTGDRHAIQATSIKLRWVIVVFPHWAPFIDALRREEFD